MLTSTLFDPTWNPLYNFLLTTSLTNPFSASATILKRKGVSGSPCRRPLFGENSVEGLPFTSTDTDADFRHPTIHWNHLVQKPNLLSIYTRKFQDTELYAFSKSTLKTIHGFWLLLASSTTSFAITALCSKCLPSMNADWPSSIMNDITFFNLLASNLATILYMHPMSEMGLYSSNDCGLTTLGIKTMCIYIYIYIYILCW